jgi:hypothetical protein
LRLDEGQAVLWTETTVENASASPVEAAVVWRAETDPGGDYGELSFRFTAQDGTRIERPLIRPEEQPSGAEDYFAPRLPAGEWRLAGQGRSLPGVRFSPDQIARARISWTAKHQPRVVVDLWSPERTLAPGERITLKAGYGLLSSNSPSGAPATPASSR